MPEVPQTHRFTIPPDWICEVLSPSTFRVDRSRKLRIYAQNEVSYAWLIDPIARYLEVKRLENGRWSDLGFFAGDDKVIAEPFPAVEIDLNDLWTSPLPPP
jgi:Uma2 family endonuclease